MYNITILKTAQIECANSVLYKGGDFNTVTTIGCHCFLLQNGDEYYLVDTGIEDIDTVNKTKSSVDDWKRGEGEFSVKENLDLLGVDCDKISKVFITHAHYDHISGAVHFKNAKFYMTKTEYDLLYSEDNKFKEFLADVKAFLTNDNVVLFDDELDVDGIKLKRRGAHTDGSMSIEVENIMFVGDTVYLQDNLEKKIPTGFVIDRESADALFAEYLEYKGKIVTSHDINEVI